MRIGPVWLAKDSLIKLPHLSRLSRDGAALVFAINVHIFHAIERAIVNLHCKQKQRADNVPPQLLDLKSMGHELHCSPWRRLPSRYTMKCVSRM